MQNLVVHVENDWRKADRLATSVSALGTQFSVINRRTMQECLLNLRRDKPKMILVGDGEQLDAVCSSVQSMKRHRADIKVLSLRSIHDAVEIRQLFRCGVDGMEDPNITHKRLIGVLDRFMRGQLVMNEKYTHHLIAEIKSGTNSNLTKRESDVLWQLSFGRTYMQICKALGFTRGTLTVHIQHLYQKLGARNRSEAIVIGINRNYIHRQPHDVQSLTE